MSSRENQKITDSIVFEIMKFPWRKMDPGKGDRRGGGKDVRAILWALREEQPRQNQQQMGTPWIGHVCGLLEEQQGYRCAGSMCKGENRRPCGFCKNTGFYSE